MSHNQPPTGPTPSSQPPGSPGRPAPNPSDSPTRIGGVPAAGGTPPPGPSTPSFGQGNYPPGPQGGYPQQPGHPPRPGAGPGGQPQYPGQPGGPGYPPGQPGGPNYPPGQPGGPGFPPGQPRGFPQSGGPGYPPGQPGGYPPGPGYPPQGGPGYPPGPPGGYGGPPGGYGGPPPGYGPGQPPRRGGTSPLLIAGGAAVLLLLLGVGALFALGIGPFARSTASPRPSGIATVPTPSASISAPTASPSVAPTASPTEEPTEEPTDEPTEEPTEEPTDEPTIEPSGSPLTPEQEQLLATIPERLRASCTPSPGDGDVLAVYGCATEDAFFRYRLYETEEAMQEQYDTDLGDAPLPDPAGTDCEEGASEHPYTIQGEEVGRLFCFDRGGIVVFEWNDPRVNVLTDAARSDEDYAALYEFWRTAGPDLPAGGQ